MMTVVIIVIFATGDRAAHNGALEAAAICSESQEPLGSHKHWRRLCFLYQGLLGSPRPPSGLLGINVKVAALFSPPFPPTLPQDTVVSTRRSQIHRARPGLSLVVLGYSSCIFPEAPRPSTWRSGSGAQRAPGRTLPGIPRRRRCQPGEAGERPEGHSVAGPVQRPAVPRGPRGPSGRRTRRSLPSRPRAAPTSQQHQDARVGEHGCGSVGAAGRVPRRSARPAAPGRSPAPAVPAAEPQGEPRTHRSDRRRGGDSRGSARRAATAPLARRPRPRSPRAEPRPSLGLVAPEVLSPPNQSGAASRQSAPPAGRSLEGRGRGGRRSSCKPRRSRHP